MKKLLIKYYAFFPLLLLCAVYVYKAMAFPIHDFANYYFGAYFLREHTFSAETYFPYLFNKEIVALGYAPSFAGFAPNTPFLAMLLYPFTFISLASAKLLFNIISSVLFVISIYRLAQFYNINKLYLVLIPLLFFVPIRNEFLFGQVYLLLFFLLTEFWIANEKNQQFKAALFLFLAIFLKVFPLLLVLIFVFKKQFKPLLFMMGIGVLFFAFSLLFVDFDFWKFYITDVLSKSANGEIAGSFVDNYQSAFMFFKRLCVYETVENPNPFFHASSLFKAFVFAFKIGIIALGYFVTRNSKNNLIIFSFWILAGILISPYGSTYTFVLLVFPFFALLKSEISNVKKVIFYSLLLLVNNFPLSFFIENNFPYSYLRLFFLILLFISFFIWLFQKSALLKTIVIGCIAFGIGTFFKQDKPEKSNAFLPKGSPLLIYDYEIKNNTLIYFYWNEKGENKTLIPFKSTTVKELKIKNNQIISKGIALILGKAHNCKPMLIDGKIILYLSDYDKGIGFYTLRKINLH